jgi:hypothetical protein
MDAKITEAVFFNFAFILAAAPKKAKSGDVF